MSVVEQIAEQLFDLTDEEILELECHLAVQRCTRQLTEHCVPESLLAYWNEGVTHV